MSLRKVRSSYKGHEHDNKWRGVETDSILRLEAEPKTDRLGGLFCFLHPKQCLGFAEVALGPVSPERDDGFSICECRDVVLSIVVGSGSIGDDSRELFSHELVGLPRRSLDSEVGSIGVACDSTSCLSTFKECLEGV